MPYGFFSYSDQKRTEPKVGRPKRDRTKVKAGRKANRRRR